MTDIIEAHAAEIARAAADGAPAGAVWATYKGLPVWAVDFDHVSKTRITEPSMPGLFTIVGSAFVDFDVADEIRDTADYIKAHR